MKKKLSEKIEIPSGITPMFEDSTLKLRQGQIELVKTLKSPGIKIVAQGNFVEISCDRGNKKEYKIMKTFVAHIKNMLSGLSSPFVYKLESANVHFPMTLKVDGKQLLINNFLGEKLPRKAEILPNVEVDVKGSQITIKSSDREAAGQTAANFEKATKLRGRDRRIFQDGIFITNKPGDEE